MLTFFTFLFLAFTAQIFGTVVITRLSDLGEDDDVPEAVSFDEGVPLGAAANCNLNHMPVVLMHGIFSSAKEMGNIAREVSTRHPDLYIHIIEVGEDNASITTPFKTQMKQVNLAINNDKCLAKAGKIDIVAHSQGGMLAFSYIAMYSSDSDAVKVHNIVTLSSPLAGFFCSVNTACFGVGTSEELYEFIKKYVYTPLVQTVIAPTAYWRDPYPDMYEKFMNAPNVLPELLGLRGSAKEKEKRKNAITAINKWVAVASDVDGAITPWFSSYFEFFEGDDLESSRVSLTESEIYLNNTFGIKTIVDRGDFVKINSHLEHTEYNFTDAGALFIREYIVDYLGTPLNK